jgi:hypothetical protein
LLFVLRPTDTLPIKPSGLLISAMTLIE